MSQAATLSPSPMNFGDPSAFSQHYHTASNNNSQSTFFGQRRTSHPHNPPLHRSSPSMAERPQARIRPRLPPQPQPSVIDLTDDSDDRPAFAPSRSHSQRPPQLGRSDAVGFADFIDLTEDGEPDLVITGVHRRSVLPPHPVRIHRNERPASRPVSVVARARSPGLFVPRDPVLEPPRQQAAFAFGGGGVFGNHNNILDHLGGGMNNLLGAAQGVFDHVLFYHPGIGAAAAHQQMPNHMDYQANAFAPRKAEHVPPPAAKEGFTRSPQESDTIICPSCEEEMIHRKDEEEPVARKGGKAPSKKDREEHPFWVVKECGHVSSIPILLNPYTNAIPGLLQSLLPKSCYCQQGLEYRLFP